MEKTGLKKSAQVRKVNARFEIADSACVWGFPSSLLLHVSRMGIIFCPPNFHFEHMTEDNQVLRKQWTQVEVKVCFPTMSHLLCPKSRHLSFADLYFPHKLWLTSRKLFGDGVLLRITRNIVRFYEVGMTHTDKLFDWGIWHRVSYCKYRFSK